LRVVKNISKSSCDSRDGSVIYNNAIANAHPEALQISDRFHLLKNLTSYITEYLKRD